MADSSTCVHAGVSMHVLSSAAHASAVTCQHLGVLVTVSQPLQEAERQDLQAKQAAFMLEVEQWSQGEVEALQAAVEARVQREQQQAQLW